MIDVDPACKFLVGDGKVQVQAQVADMLESSNTCVFTHGCFDGPRVAAAAVTAIRDGGRRASLRPAAQGQVYNS